MVMQGLMRYTAFLSLFLLSFDSFSAALSKLEQSKKIGLSSIEIEVKDAFAKTGLLSTQLALICQYLPKDSSTYFVLKGYEGYRKAYAVHKPSWHEKLTGADRHSIVRIDFLDEHRLAVLLTI